MNSVMAIGVDIGGTNLRAARIASDGRIDAKLQEKSDPDPEIALGRIIDLIRKIDRPDVAAVGIGVPGRVDHQAGLVLSGGYLDLSRIPVVSRIEAAVGKPVVVDNDCNMALLAEIAAGAASGLLNVAMLTIGTGIGGAIAENGKIVRGARNAGQLGHITVDHHGRDCVCGRRGCVETESSGMALRRHMTEAGFPADTTIETLFLQAGQEDARARTVLARWAAPLRAAIDTLSATLDPDLVLLGGGLGQAAARALEAFPPAAPWFRTPVGAASLGDDAGVIGAGLCAMKGRPQRPAGKRVVLVNGVPAAGKSSVSEDLSRRTGWPVLALDVVKNPFLEHLGGGDREFNRTLGRASYQAIWSIVREAPAGSTFIIDAWFGFQPIERLREYLVMAGVSSVAEIWCHAPAEVLAARYAARSEQRLPGHPDASYIPELKELAKRAEPTHVGPLYTVDTTTPRDCEGIAKWAASVL
ncbi:MAG: ROK family protein [Shinella sp.]|nr:ROK family protein [Shinella sp.]